MHDDRMIWKGTALMLFAPSPTINSIISNGAEFTLQSLYVVGVPVGNRPPMTGRDGASELPNLNEWFVHPQGGQPRSPQARGTAVAEFK
jgi:hypothetical protein